MIYVHVYCTRRCNYGINRKHIALECLPHTHKLTWNGEGLERKLANMHNNYYGRDVDVKLTYLQSSAGYTCQTSNGFLRNPVVLIALLLVIYDLEPCAGY